MKALKWIILLTSLSGLLIGCFIMMDIYHTADTGEIDKEHFRLFGIICFSQFMLICYWLINYRKDWIKNANQLRYVRFSLEHDKKNTIFDESSTEKEKRRRERFRNLLNQTQILFLEHGSQSDQQVFDLLVEATREDITLEELEKLSPDLIDLASVKHPPTFRVQVVSRANSGVISLDWWYDIGDEYTVRNSTHNGHKVYKVDNGPFVDMIILEEHAKIIEG